MDQEPVTRFQLAALEHIVPDGEKRLGKACGFDEWQLVGNRQDAAFIGNTKLGISPAVDECHHRVAQAIALYGGANRRHMTGNFKPWDLRMALGGRIASHPLQHIRPVDPCCCHLDQYLAWSRLRDRHLLRHQNFGTARR